MNEMNYSFLTPLHSSHTRGGAKRMQLGLVTQTTPVKWLQEKSSPLTFGRILQGVRFSKFVSLNKKI